MLIHSIGFLDAGLLYPGYNLGTDFLFLLQMDYTPNTKIPAIAGNPNIPNTERESLRKDKAGRLRKEARVNSGTGQLSKTRIAASVIKVAS